MDEANENLVATEAEEIKKDKDWLIRVCSVQIIVCAVLFAVFLMCIKTAGNTQLSEWADEILSYTLTRQQISEAFARIKQYVSTPAGAWAVSLEGEQTETTSQALSLLGMGGEDLQLYEAEAEATFSHYSLTVSAVCPADGRVSSAFGYRINPVTGDESFHSGLDIAAKENSCIRAAFYGKVLRTGTSEISGNFVILSHSDGLETRYYHCNDILVSEGTVVRQGETIARVGSTGRSTGPHLHFEIRIDGIRVNPAYILYEY